MTSSAKAQSRGGEAPGFRVAEGFGQRREKTKSICTVYVVEGNICMYIHLHDVFGYVY